MTKTLCHPQFESFCERNEIEQFASVGTWYLDVFSSEFQWSDEMFKIWNRNTEEGYPLLAEFTSSVHHSDRFKWELFINNACLDTNSQEIELRIIDGAEQRWIRLSAKGMSNGHMVTGIKGFCKDITNMKKLEHHFELTKDLFK